MYIATNVHHHICIYIYILHISPFILYIIYYTLYGIYVMCLNCIYTYIYIYITTSLYQYTYDIYIYIHVCHIHVSYYIYIYHVESNSAPLGAVFPLRAPCALRRQRRQEHWTAAWYLRVGGWNENVNIGNMDISILTYRSKLICVYNIYVYIYIYICCTWHEYDMIFKHCSIC